MSKIEYLLRHKLILQKLRKGPAAFAEIGAYLKLESEWQEYKLEVSKRTFQRDLNAIRMLYGTEITCNKKDNTYSISEPEQPESNMLQNRMLEAFDTVHALQLTTGLHEYIHFESRRPQGTQHFHGLLHALKNQFLVRFQYHKFWDEKPTARTVVPLALKEFRGRWYVLAQDRKDNRIKTFGLDRILDLEISSTPFKRPQNFRPAAMFRHSFGIISPEDAAPEEVVLAFTPVQGKYIKSYPLHHSQQVISDSETGCHVKLTLQLTHDFIMELLSFGNELRIVSPESLRKDIKKRHQEAVKQYA